MSSPDQSPPPTPTDAYNSEDRSPVLRRPSAEKAICKAFLRSRYNCIRITIGHEEEDPQRRRLRHLCLSAIDPDYQIPEEEEEEPVVRPVNPLLPGLLIHLQELSVTINQSMASIESGIDYAALRKIKNYTIQRHAKEMLLIHHSTKSDLILYQGVDEDAYNEVCDKYDELRAEIEEDDNANREFRYCFSVGLRVGMDNSVTNKVGNLLEEISMHIRISRDVSGMMEGQEKEFFEEDNTDYHRRVITYVKELPIWEFLTIRNPF